MNDTIKFDLDEIAQKCQKIVEVIQGTLLGNELVPRLSLCALMARGHLLIEDIPGVGKTTLSRVLARVSGLDSNRIQFTNDLLPTDILGHYMYDQASKEFVLRRGPIHTNILLADEINRASPKSQSALLEAMEERTVSLEGKTTPLPEPFFVIATQNPYEHVGVSALPESQLDRFMFKLSIGYPEAEAEKLIIASQYTPPAEGEVLANVEEINRMCRYVDNIKCSEPIIHYIQNLCHHSRHSPEFKWGLSPRAGIVLRRAAQAWALLRGHDYVIPEDVQDIFPPTCIHRLVLKTSDSPESRKEAIETLLASVNVD